MGVDVSDFDENFENGPVQRFAGRTRVRSLKKNIVHDLERRWLGGPLVIFS